MEQRREVTEEELKKDKAHLEADYQKVVNQITALTQRAEQIKGAIGYNNLLRERLTKPEEPKPEPETT